jgi:hypothetical protein
MRRLGVGGHRSGIEEDLPNSIYSESAMTDEKKIERRIQERARPSVCSVSSVETELERCVRQTRGTNFPEDHFRSCEMTELLGVHPTSWVFSQAGGRRGKNGRQEKMGNR